MIAGDETPEMKKRLQDAELGHWLAACTYDRETIGGISPGAVQNFRRIARIWREKPPKKFTVDAIADILSANPGSKKELVDAFIGKTKCKKSTAYRVVRDAEQRGLAPSFRNARGRGASFNLNPDLVAKLVNGGIPPERQPLVAAIMKESGCQKSTAYRLISKARLLELVQIRNN
jgi:hypothetical protein